jgi:hypothetical protein
MKKILSVLSWAILLLPFIMEVNPRLSFAQPLEIDQEQRLKPQKPGVDDLRKNIPAPDEQNTRVSREVKFVAGKDNLWFTADDQIYHYFLNACDSAGLVTKRSCFKAGPDGIAQSADDELVDYQTFEYSAEGKIMAETSFDNKNVKQYTAVYDYDLKGRKIGLARVNPKNEEIRSIAYYYNPKGQLAKDVEYAGKQLEKYHKFEYDRKGLMTRAMEYHVKEKGIGPDGKWFTADDVVSSTKEFFYNKDGSKSMEKKYVGAGPDGQWFTKDDVLQYYTLFHYGK